MQDKTYLTRSECPCCRALASRAELHVASKPPAEALPFDQHSQFASGYSSRRVFFTYLRCGECGALYCPIYYTQKQLEMLYGRQAENMAEVPLEARVRTQAGYAAQLMKHSRGGGSFLEIGPDIGLFAEQCAKAGQFDKFWFFEPNCNVHAELTARFSARRHSIHTTMSPTNDLPRQSVSTAALIHVLDHLLDPAAFLAEICNKLEDDGVLLIVTHNTTSLLARILGRRWPPFALQHPQLYAPESITRLLERVGFAVVDLIPATNWFPLMHLINAGLSVVGLSSLVSRAGGPVIPIRLGNMAVIARKQVRQ